MATISEQNFRERPLTIAEERILWEKAQAGRNPVLRRSIAVTSAVRDVIIDTRDNLANGVLRTLSKYL